MKRLLPLLIAAALVVVACSSPSDTIAENIAENVDGVTDVDINSATGEIKVETSDGSISIGGAEIPSDLFVPLPAGYDVQAVIEAEDQVSVSVAYDKTRYDELVAYFTTWVASDSHSWEHNMLTLDQGGAEFRTDVWESDIGGINVNYCHTVGSDGKTPNNACVLILGY